MNEYGRSLKGSAPEALFKQEIEALQRLTNRVFANLLPLQWVAAVACAAWVSPRTWAGGASSLHVHIGAAFVIGGLLTVFPMWLIRCAPTAAVTRYVAATAQMLFSGLFIHLMGGRIEAHFHVFGSLALLAFYRDNRVFIPAVGVTFIDHLLRGVLWPESIFGIMTPSVLRAIEHGGWVVFEAGFLMWGVAQSRGHLRQLAVVQVSLANERDDLERRVVLRTGELAEARDYFANVLDSLDAHLCILDSQGAIITTNHAWREFGSQRGAAPNDCGVDSNYLSVCRNARGPCRVKAVELAEAIEAVIRGDSDGYVIEYDCHEPDNKRWFQARVSPFIGASKAAAVVAHVEVTDRVLATQASKEESRRAADLAQIITESPNEVYVLNQADLRFEVVNDGALHATGYSRDELLQLTPMDLMPRYDKESYQKLIEPLAQRKVLAIDFQSEHRGSDGRTYPVQVSLNAAVYNGLPVYVAFVTDLSEVRRLEGRLAQSQKLESIGQLAAGIAHEINTPMQCVSSNIDFLEECHNRLFEIVDSLLGSLESEATSWSERKQAAKQLIEEARYVRIATQAPAALHDAGVASGRIIEIVQAMKALSHPESRNKGATDVNEVLRNSVTIASNRWKYVAKLTLDLDTDLPAIPALQTELCQVFINLIVNAADAIVEKSGDGGPLGRITVRSRFDNEVVRIEIDDTGAGIPEAIRDRVFDLFFTTKQVGKGTGQGLAITYDVVVNKHGGTIDLLSTEGEGTTFVVCLPLAEAERAVREQPASATV